MDVRRGYKHTVVGVIPEDWEVAPVGQAFVICNNLRMPISQAVRETMIGSFPYYGPTSIQGYINEYRVEGEYALIGEDGDHFLKWRHLPMTQLVRGYFNVNNHAHLVKGTKNATAWFYYYFSHRDLTPYLTRQGAGRFKLKKSTLIEIPCAIPPTKAEQEAIAKALRDVEDLTLSLERLLAKKRQMKQGAMQELLTGQKRLPGSSGSWKMKRIAEIATPSAEKNSTGAHLTVLTCSKHLGFVDSLGYFKNQVFSRDTRGYKIIRRGQIGYPSNHVEEGSIGLQDLYDAALVSPIYVVFSVTEEVDSYFLHRLLKLDFYRREFATATSSSVDRRGSLRWPAFSEITVNLPSVEEQAAIASILKDMDAEITALEAKLTKARQLKQGMMQELLTGRIRLV